MLRELTYLHFEKITKALIVVLVIAFAPACFLEKPKVTDPSKANTTFKHSGFETSCVECHEKDRPAPVNGLPHGNNGDCVSCHRPSDTWKGSILASAGFSHNPAPTTCISCHINKRPSTIINGFDHSIAGMGDCVSCHHSGGVTWADGAFAHSPRPVSCAGCHEGQRPTNNTGWVGYTPTKPFDFTKHGGTMDCNSCHSSTNQYTLMSNWTGGNFVHNSSVTSCTECHSSSQWPSTNGPFIDANGTNVASFNHATQGTGDCIGCHQKALNNVSAATPNYTWSQTGTSYPTTLCGISSKQFSNGLCTWNNQVITAANIVSTPIVQTMLHSSSQVSSTLLQNCIQCHAGAATGQYNPGYYHSKITTQPTACIDCHGAGTLLSTGAATNGMPSSFTGPNGTARSPVTPEMNHFAKKWVLSGTTWSRSTTLLINQECSTCHNNPGGSWANSNYHMSIGTQPTGCIDCHANNDPKSVITTNPNPQTPTAFDHTNIVGECVSCHASPTNTSGTQTANIALWANGKYHPTAGTLTQCNSCHNSQRPTTNSGWIAPLANAPFDYTNHGNGLDCMSCHTTTNFTSMNGWTGGKFTHTTSNSTSCIGCHTSQRPTTVISGFNHQVNGMGECIGCHTQALTNVIAQGANPSMTAWVGTGESFPSGLTGTTTLTVSKTTLTTSVTPITTFNQVTSSATTTVNLPMQMLHSSTQIPSVHYTNGALKCTDCHINASATPATYAGGLMHKNPATNSLWATQPTACKDCHANTLPTGITGTSLHSMDHASKYTNGTLVSASECTACHTLPGVTGSWGSASYHANLGTKVPANCSVCHYPEVKNILSTVTNKMKHNSTQVTQDCITCHAMPTSAQIATSGYPTASLWSGGKYHSKIATQPTACNDCHSGQKPSVTTQSMIDATQATKEYMSHSSAMATGDCKVCHTETNSLTIGSQPSAWSQTVLFHTGKPTGVTTCKECHGLTNGNGSVAGTGNTIPAGETASTTVSSVGNSGATITPYFNPPASGQPIYASYTHLDSNSTAYDCTKCHTVPAINATSAYTVWKQGKFHQNVTAPTSCANCHYKEMPNVSFTGYNHVSLVSTSGTVTLPNGSKLTMDCKSCHTSNVGTNWLGATGGSPHPTNSPFPTSCNSCHSSDRPSMMFTRVNGNWTQPTTFTYFDGHQVTGHYTNKDCYSCHRPKTTTLTVWTGTTNWNHTNAQGANITFCMPCHYQEGQNKHGSTSSRLTANNYDGNCYNCHTTRKSWNSN